MSTENDVARSLGSWLKENRHEDADRILDVVFDQIPATPQRRASWPAWRFPIMNSTIARFGFAAVAAVAIAIIGYSLLRGPNGVGPPAATPTPTPDAPPVTLNATDLGVPLTDGRHAFVIGEDRLLPHLYTVELTTQGTWVPRELGIGAVTFDGPNANGAFLGFYSIQAVYRDPCHPEAGYAGSHTGWPNSDDLVNELSALAGFDASAPNTVRVGGQTATHFVISNTIDTDAAACTDGGLLPLFVTSEGYREAELGTRTNHSPATNGGTSLEIWVAGNVNTLVIIGEVGRADPAALEEIVDSIGFRGASPN